MEYGGDQTTAAAVLWRRLVLATEKREYAPEKLQCSTAKLPGSPICLGRCCCNGSTAAQGLRSPAAPLIPRGSHRRNANGALVFG